MDLLRDFLDTVKEHGVATGHFRGLLHVLIGQRVSKTDGALVCSGMNWRSAAAALKQARWDREAVRELGIDPSELAPRDREKYWYTAIARANLNTEEARTSAEAFAAALGPLGYVVG